MQTLEGVVICKLSDVVTVAANERRPMQRAVFDHKYTPTGGQHTRESGRYAKRAAFVQAVHEFVG